MKQRVKKTLACVATALAALVAMSFPVPQAAACDSCGAVENPAHQYTLVQGDALVANETAIADIDLAEEAGMTSEEFSNDDEHSIVSESTESTTVLTEGEDSSVHSAEEVEISEEIVPATDEGNSNQESTSVQSDSASTRSVALFSRIAGTMINHDLVSLIALPQEVYAQATATAATATASEELASEMQPEGLVITVTNEDGTTITKVVPYDAREDDNETSDEESEIDDIIDSSNNQENIGSGLAEGGAAGNENDGTSEPETGEAGALDDGKDGESDLETSVGGADDNGNDEEVSDLESAEGGAAEEGEEKSDNPENDEDNDIEIPEIFEEGSVERQVAIALAYADQYPDEGAVQPGALFDAVTNPDDPMEIRVAQATEKFSDYELQYMFGANSVSKRIAVRVLLDEAGLYPDTEELYEGLSEEEIREREVDDIRALASFYDLAEFADNWEMASSIGVDELSEMIAAIREKDFTYAKPDVVDTNFLDDQLNNTLAARNEKAVSIAKSMLPTSWLETFEKQGWTLKSEWKNEFSEEDERKFDKTYTLRDYDYQAAGLTCYGTKDILLKTERSDSYAKEKLIHEFAHFAVHTFEAADWRNKAIVNRLYKSEVDNAEPFMRKYSTLSQDEYLADFTAYWQLYPEKKDNLAKAAPNTAAFVEELLDNFKEFCHIK